MLRPATSVVRALTLLGALFGTVVVGVIDVVTGADIQVVSLYFLPLVLAGWRLPRTDAVVVSLFATLVWLGALYATGARYSQPSVWIINFVTQGLAFLTVAMLVSRLSMKLEDEQARRRTDALTGLLNRSGLMEQAKLMLSLCRRNSRPVCLVYLDLDNFKVANDRLGHGYGDTLLRQCGGLITSCIRASDVAARIGGDEFVVFLPETDRPQAMEVCQRISQGLAVAPEFRSASVTGSVGVAFDADASLQLDELISLADADMYRMKRARRDTRHATLGDQ
jgi:diguanylate cyclase (GGDEF)-like protein